MKRQFKFFLVSVTMRIEVNPVSQEINSKRKFEVGCLLQTRPKTRTLPDAPTMVKLRRGLPEVLRSRNGMKLDLSYGSMVNVRLYHRFLYGRS
jgi:hypothetical protein